MAVFPKKHVISHCTLEVQAKPTLLPRGFHYGADIRALQDIRSFLASVDPTIQNAKPSKLNPRPETELGPFVSGTRLLLRNLN